MPSLKISVVNLSDRNQTAHVFDTLTGGTRPVEGSPFDLRPGERSAPFAVKADNAGRGIVAFRCASGLTQSNIGVVEGNEVPLMG
jgi:hypothetical protein